MKRPLSEAMLKKQELDREETYKKIRAAAKELKDEHRPITRAALTKGSGLAPSTFSKEHVKEFLKVNYGIGENNKISPTDNLGSAEVTRKEYDRLIVNLEDLRKRLEKSEQKEKEKQSKLKAAETKQGEFDHEIKVLRGELDIAKRRIRILTGKSTKADEEKVGLKLVQSSKNEGTTSKTDK